MSNGLQVVAAPVHKLPIATVIALVDAGATCGNKGFEGIAQLTADLVLEGTTRMNGLELVARFERLGASVVTSADWDGATVRLTALRDQLPSAIQLLGEILCDPAFPEREVERLKGERLAELLQLRAEPRGLADEMFTRFLYEPRSRYASPEAGSEESVSTIAREDVERFHAERYRPAGVTLIIAGDIDADTAERLAADTFGDWSGSAPVRCETSDRPARRSRAIHVVSKPDAAQTELRLGSVYLPRSHPDYYESVVMNAVLGGLFTSRINLKLREKHGYTYAAFSQLDWRRHAGPFVVTTAVGSEVTAPAARAAVAEIEAIRNDRVSDAELSLATSFLAGIFPIRYETTDAIAGALAALVAYGLPDDFYDGYRERVRAVTTEGVLRVAREHLDAEALQMVVVGDLESVHKPLEDIRFGPVTTYDTRGEVLP